MDNNTKDFDLEKASKIHDAIDTKVTIPIDNNTTKEEKIEEAPAKVVHIMDYFLP